MEPRLVYHISARDAARGAYAFRFLMPSSSRRFDETKTRCDRPSHAPSCRHPSCSLRSPFRRRCGIILAHNRPDHAIANASNQNSRHAETDERNSQPETWHNLVACGQVIRRRDAQPQPVEEHQNPSRRVPRPTSDQAQRAKDNPKQHQNANRKDSAEAKSRRARHARSVSMRHGHTSNIIISSNPL